MQQIIDDILLRHRFDALAAALHDRDIHTASHGNRVMLLSLELGKKCGLPEKDLKLLRFVAQFHDIGKIGIPDRILLKQGTLENNEWETMKTHATLGQRMLLATHLPDIEMVALAVRHHHENFDGSGYPDGLAGETIPMLSRIVAVVDNYDALASTGSYRRARGQAEILDILSADAAHKFDPEIHAAFVKIAANPEFAFTRRMHEAHALRGKCHAA